MQDFIVHDFVHVCPVSKISSATVQSQNGTWNCLTFLNKDLLFWEELKIIVTSVLHGNFIKKE